MNKSQMNQFRKRRALVASAMIGIGVLGMGSAISWGDSAGPSTRPAESRERGEVQNISGGSAGV